MSAPGTDLVASPAVRETASRRLQLTASHFCERMARALEEGGKAAAP
jgi:hypothetical protein